ncbi:MAG: hypothetical protein LBE92_03820 [Chryseobacterium sp.]|jgi:hypothetical protein|uniref:hypothetical protein n=1 Tax=Chryseobacterium sp. TaxID=1871047 RepID=UPI002820905D|nr:hypothetical protein [Chryseobacterium sp.]MDR2235229.1 hypothetical protein [Chryseobacterium sp.]
MKRLLFSGAVFAVFYCKAQQVFPLNTDYEIIPDHSYLKDLNKELLPYIGIYKANYQGNEIALFIAKDNQRPLKRVNKDFYRDILIIRYLIKNSSGHVLQDVQNTQFPSSDSSYHFIESIATNPLQNTVTFIYSGTNCGVGWGKILLKKLNATQISWTYRANSSVITDQNCPGNPDLTIYLPETENLIFTRQ